MSATIEFEYADIDSLVPYAMNSRTHSDEQVAQIAASIREFGFLVPVLTDESGNLIAGHGRALAARKLGITKIPTVKAEGLTEAQCKAYVIADNQLALNAGWDEDILRIELQALRDMDFDTSLLGFDEAAIADFLAEENGGLTDPDARYCDVIVRRWQAFSGLEATHEKTGKTFEEHLAECRHQS